MTLFATKASWRPVHSLRRHILQHRVLASFLVAAALLLKVLVPAGFMPGVSGGMMTIQLCTGQGVQTIRMEIPGKAQHDEQGHKKADMPCAFSGFSATALSAADPILLAVAIAFILTMGFRATTRFVATKPAYLRPPSQGPPATA